MPTPRSVGFAAGNSLCKRIVGELGCTGLGPARKPKQALLRPLAVSGWSEKEGLREGGAPSRPRRAAEIEPQRVLFDAQSDEGVGLLRQREHVALPLHFTVRGTG